MRSDPCGRDGSLLDRRLHGAVPDRQDGVEIGSASLPVRAWVCPFSTNGGRKRLDHATRPIHFDRIYSRNDRDSGPGSAFGDLLQDHRTLSRGWKPQVEVDFHELSSMVKPGSDFHDFHRNR